MRADAQASLDLEAGPLWRMTLFDLGADRPHRLLVVIHHLAVDGVSWRILLEDLEQLYEQAAAGEPLSLPAKTTSWQRGPSGYSSTPTPSVAGRVVLLAGRRAADRAVGLSRG